MLVPWVSILRHLGAIGLSFWCLGVSFCSYFDASAPFGLTLGVGAVPLANQAPEDSREICGKAFFG